MLKFSAVQGVGDGRDGRLVSERWHYVAAVSGSEY